ncbi:hypothetical protein V1477_009768 [Vespula maculifrons]|uniref:Uncharacterized protein n=1 Tax=Vespula maculifrons TaxID=7453 RepID=A0ABD2CBK8_VESMC
MKEHHLTPPISAKPRICKVFAIAKSAVTSVKCPPSSNFGKELNRVPAKSIIVLRLTNILGMDDTSLNFAFIWQSALG